MLKYLRVFWWQKSSTITPVRGSCQHHRKTHLLWQCQGLCSAWSFQAAMANQPVPWSQGGPGGWLRHTDSMGTHGTCLGSCKGPHPCGGAALLQQVGQFQCVCLHPNKCKGFLSKQIFFNMHHQVLTCVKIERGFAEIQRRILLLNKFAAFLVLRLLFNCLNLSIWSHWVKEVPKSKVEICL